MFSHHLQTLSYSIRNLVPWSGNEPGHPALEARSFSHWTTRGVPVSISFDYRPKIRCSCSATQSHLTLWDPMDCNPRGSSVHGIFQARILGWVTISFVLCSNHIDLELEPHLLRATIPFRFIWWDSFKNTYVWTPVHINEIRERRGLVICIFKKLPQAIPACR